MKKKIGTMLIILSVIVAAYTLWRGFYYDPSGSAEGGSVSDILEANANYANSISKNSASNLTSTRTKKPAAKKKVVAIPAKITSAGYLPARLIIPRLNINAKVDPEGITFKGNMGAPSNFSDVGWWKYGAVPGQLGSAVIDGHNADSIGLGAVFNNLSALQPGDDVYVVRNDGTRLHFIVERLATMPFNANTTAVFNSSDTARLNLITCTGTWIQQLKTNNKRVVVYTTLAG